MFKLKSIIFMIIGVPVSVQFIPQHLHIWLIPAFAFLAIFLTLNKIKTVPAKYINQGGYVVLSSSNELEHRYIAKQILGRDLKHNEVIHHINGKRVDNEIRNLCLMDRERHEFFHSWLQWKKNKSRKYPPIKQQKRVLEEEYGGILLENHKLLKPTKKREQSDLTKKQKFVYKYKIQSGELSINEEKNKFKLQKKLFNELRKERKRIANEKNVPVYMVFDNKTLMEMSEMMPVTESMMIQVRGVGPYKLQLYGDSFIEVIKKFKIETLPEVRRRKDSA